MLTPFLGFSERDIVGTFKVAAAANSGLAMGLSTGDASPLTPTPYGNSFGTIAPVSCLTAGLLRETGWLLQPVTANGPSIFSVLASIYDESVAVGQVAALVLSKTGAFIATDQYSTGTGAIVFNGSVPLETICGIHLGQPRVLQTGDQARLQFKGAVTQRTLTLALFQIL